MAIQSLFGSTSNVFGPSPAEIALARQREAQQEQLLRNQMISQQGQEFGPFRGLYQAGLRFGDIAGQAVKQGLFPAPVDPQLQEAVAVQTVLSKYANQNQTDPNILNKIGQELMSIAPNAGLRALTIAQQFAKESPFGKIDPSKFTSESLQTYQRTRNISDLVPIEKVKALAPGQEIIRAAGALGFAIPSDVTAFTKDQWVAIDAKIRQDETNRAAASAAKMNFEDPRGKVEAISLINNQLKPFVQQITALDQAISLRRDDKSPFSQRLFEQTVAGAFGDANKAKTEIERLVNTGNLGERVTNTLSLFVSGNIGNATKEDQLESLNAIRDYIAKQYDSTATPFRGALKEKADEIAPLSATKFTRPKLPEGQQYIPIDVVNQYKLTKGQRLKQGDKEFIYNGDGTITILKGQ